MTEIYRHRQTGWVIIIFFGLFTIMEAVAMYKMTLHGLSPLIYLGLAVFALFGYLGSSLTVIVSPDELRLWFGPGICKRSYATRDIISIEVITQPWYYGYGIKYLIGKKAWLYNVSGLGAVELVLADGRRRRVGTPEPERLKKAIKEAIGTWKT